MGKNLAKTPLTAIIFASVWCFSMPFTSVFLSEGYKEVLTGFTMPLPGYAYMIAYGFWISIILAIIFTFARGKGVGLMLLMAITVPFTQWVAPVIGEIVFFDASDQRTRSDLIFLGVEGVVATIFLLVVVLLLFKSAHESEPAPEPVKKPGVQLKQNNAQDNHGKYRLRKRNFVVTLIVLPVIYMVIFFLAWYFLLLRKEDARAFYMAGIDMDTSTFSQYLVYILMNDSKQIPMSLVKGLIYVLPLSPLMLELAHKRVMFIVTTVMLLLGPAVRMLISSAVIPDPVRIAHLIEMSAAAVVFGTLTAFMMHVCVFKEASPEPNAASVPSAIAKRERAAAENAAQPASKVGKSV